MTDNTSHPDPTPSTMPVADSPAVVSHPDPGSDPKPRRRSTRTLLIAGGAVLAAAVLAGGGIAVGAAIADDADDDDRTTASRTSDDDDSDGDDSDGDAAASDQSAVVGTDSADELNEIIATASKSAEGEAVGIEANGDGSWDVQFETSTGAETEVRVASNGSADVLSTNAAEADDSAPQGSLDTDTVDKLVAAALAEVDGKVVDLEIDDDSASPFDVSVLRSDRRTVDLALDSDLKVVTSDGA